VAIIKNEDLDLLIQVEELLHNKLEQTNGIKDSYNGKEYIYFDENDKDYEIWVKYWNMVERFIADKKVVNKRSANFNKKNAEYHPGNPNPFSYNN
jgi:hypothetical protein